MKKLRKENKMSLQQVADAIGAPSYQKVQSYERGVLPRADMLEKIVEFFNVDFNCLFGVSSQNKTDGVKLYFAGQNIDKDLNLQDFEFIPLVESKAGATPGFIDISRDTQEGYVCIHTSRIPRTNKNIFAFRVKCDSMYPHIKNEDIVAVEECNSCDNNMCDIYLVRFTDINNDIGLALKRLYQEQDVLILLSDNIKYQPKILHHDNAFAIIGKVIWLWREI